MIKVFFSPLGGCEAEVVKVIEAATKEILVQAYSFTNYAIAHALIAAKQRDVPVRVIQDLKASQERGSVLHQLKQMGIECWTDAAHPIAHNKIIILDGGVVVTGSFNFSYRAEHANAENLCVLTDSKTAALYRANWRHHLEHSQPYTGQAPATLIAPEATENDELTQP